MKLILIILLISLIGVSLCDRHGNKYSAEANSKITMNEKYDPDFRNLHKPFRMAKLNLVWTKAQHVRKKIYSPDSDPLTQSLPCSASPNRN